MSTSPFSFTALAQAITRFENSQWPNNPGALTDSQGNRLNFGSFDAGFAALESRLGFDMSGQSKVYSPNMTLQQFENVYTGGDPNAGPAVASILGTSPDTPMSQLSDQALGHTPTPQTGGASGSPTPFSWSNPSSWFVNQDPNTPLISVGGVVNGIGKYAGSDVVRVVAVLVGLVLLAGAVFGFKTLGNTVVNVTKKATETAAIAA